MIKRISSLLQFYYKITFFYIVIYSLGETLLRMYHKHDIFTIASIFNVTLFFLWYMLKNVFTFVEMALLLACIEF